jgi:predicted PurR-regulated permease PerM
VAKISPVPGWQRAVVVLTGTVVGVVVISCLYWAQVVFIPLALALFLTFLLAPLVRTLQRRHLGRLPSVIVVVLLAAGVLGGVAWLVTIEATSLANDLPKYVENLNGRIRSWRQASQGSFWENVEKASQNIAREWEGLPAGSSGAGPARSSEVVIQPDNSSLLARLPAMAKPLVETLGGLVLALVLAVFMLLKREDLRNRLIRVVGHGRLTVMTKAVDDAGQRISRFLLMQLIINISFGVVLSIVLFAIQFPYAWLWGLLAVLLRYVPYVGSWIMAALLIALSLGIYPGWIQPFLVLGCIVGLELVTANVAEPRLFGHSIGVSEVALLLSAAFWAFLWGPIGLILSSPLTVCLVVLGKYVPQLEFLYVLLGDEEGLTPDVTYYQRLLARDQDEAAQLVLMHAKTLPPEQIYDELLVPALNYVKRDRARDDLTEADEQFVFQATREIVEDLGERRAAALEQENTKSAAPPKVRILGCPGHDEGDRLALEMLWQLLDLSQWEVAVLSPEMLSAELVALAGAKAPAVICIAALPPGGLARTRYLCKRLRGRLPEAKIVVGRWGLKDNVEQNEEPLREAGADQVAATLLETRRHLSTWLPVLAQAEAKTTRNGVAREGPLVAV